VLSSVPVATGLSHSIHTFILSDVHLADTEPPHPTNPLWKKFKQPQFFTDSDFSQFLAFVQKQSSSPIELVLNGDILDFDSVMAIPRDAQGKPTFQLSWLEKIRGLKPEEAKSRFKLGVILDNHPVWVAALASFLKAGHRIIFVIGNHDIELHWPSVQQDLAKRLGAGDEPSRVQFNEWFFVSNKDTLIEHGNQYDAYGLCSNPINPLIRDRHGVHVRIPFGNLAGKFILNGMGLMNPHIESSYIKDSLAEYLVFFFKYVMRTQPLMIWSWFWSAIATLVVSLTEGLRPSMTDPLTIGDRIEAIAEKAGTSPKTVLALRELHAHPAYFNPIQILRELWLDRALLLGLAVFISFQIFSFTNVFVSASYWWFFVPLLLLLPIPIFYARGVSSDVLKSQAAAIEASPIAAKITGVSRVVHGHTHREMHFKQGDLEYLNTGTWSPAFHDVECTQAFGRKCFAWIRPESSAMGRTAGLFEWKAGAAVPIPEVAPPGQ
jgi:UDP-2,3-diacylglucosamine pyrophosphatase LpxH